MTSEKDSKAVAIRAVNSLPAISSEAYAHIGKYSGALVLAAFEAIGGIERFAAWCDGNPTDYYTKIFSKTIQKSQQVDISATLSIDDAIERLERQNSIQAAEFSEVVEDGEFFDL